MSNAGEQPSDARPEPEDGTPVQDDLAKVFAPPSETGSAPQEPPAAPGFANPYAPPPGAAPTNPYAWPQAGPQGWPGYAGYPAGQPQQQWSGYAITSLVTGILGGFCFLWAVSIGFGIAALRTIRPRNQRGRGMAIAGIVLSCLWLVGTVAFVAMIPFGHSGHASSPSIFGPGGLPGTKTIFELQPGDCFDKPTNSDKTYLVELQSCDDPHYGEVFATAPLTESAYPGKQRVVDESQHACAAKADDYLDGARLPDSMQIRFFYPDASSWSDPSHHLATCMFVDRNGKTTGSVLDGPTAEPTAIPKA